MPNPSESPVSRPDVEEITVRAEAASKGPFFAYENDLIGGWSVMSVDKPPSQIDFKAGESEIASFVLEADAKFIARAYQDVSELCRYVKELEAVVELGRPFMKEGIDSEHDRIIGEPCGRDELAWRLEKALAALGDGNEGV